MQTKPTPAEGQNSTKLEAESALRGAACSPSSDTPETDAYANHQNLPQAMGYVPIEHACNLERERNAALANCETLGDVVAEISAEKMALAASLAELHAALVRYEADVDAKAPSEHRQMMDRAAALLPENEKSPSVDATE